MFKHAIILAAGKGERLLPLTKDTPKALVQLGGKPLIYYSLSQLIGQVQNIVVTVGHCGGKLAVNVIESGATTVLNTINMGNAWWLFNTLMKFINEPVLVLPCDNVVHLDLDFLYKSYIKFGSPACMLVPVKPIFEIQGDYILGSEGRVQSIGRSIESEIYCSGMQVINPSLINSFLNPLEDFAEVWAGLIDEDHLFYSEIYPNTWFSVNTNDELLLAKEVL